MSWWDDLADKVAAPFADYGVEDWQEDATAAADQAADWLHTAADQRGWPADLVEDAEAAIVHAVALADDDVDKFWMELAASWPAPADPPAGWDKLAAAMGAADQAADTAAAGRDLGSVSSVLEGTAEGIVDDVVDSSTWLRKWGPWLLGGTVILLLVVWVAVKAKG